MPKPVLYGIVGSLVLMFGLFLGARWLVEHEQAQIPPDKMWVPLATVAVIASKQELDELLGEIGAFAAEKGFAVKNLPKKEQQSVAVRLAITPRTYFAVDNYGMPQQRFMISAYSHDDPSVWKAEWEALTDRLRSRLGDERITVRLKPPPS